MFPLLPDFIKHLINLEVGNTDKLPCQATGSSIRCYSSIRWKELLTC